MRSRRVYPQWRVAVKKTTVPPTIFDVHSVERYNAMVVMKKALPNLQQIIGLRLGHFGGGHMWRDGQDPDEEEAAQTADWTTHDVEIIFGCRKLQIFEIDICLNGIYPGFFSNFPCLLKLTLVNTCIKLDLGMLDELPLLKELFCNFDANLGHCVTGNIDSLRVLKETLERVVIHGPNPNVEGDFMVLADFPYLRALDLFGTAVSGDIRDIGEHDFVALEEGELSLPKGVHGGCDFVFPAVSDVRRFFEGLEARVIHLLAWTYRCRISEESDDWYHGFPFYAELVEAGPWPDSRVGWRWTKGYNDACEVNWLGPEP